MALQLRPEVFTILRALIEERVGIDYAYADRELFAEKVGARAMEAGFDSLLDYYYFLRYDPKAEAELEALVDALVVGETYFFRELDQLATLVGEYLLPLHQQGVAPRVWCAACATGEEPLTLAMLLADAGMLERTTIVASDVCQRFVERARRGEHAYRALRDVPNRGLEQRYIEKTAAGRARVSPAIAERIDWRRCNLADPKAIAAQGRFHAILCRNVLIYFSEETTLRTVGALRDQLEPGGVLLVGVSESLLRFGAGLVCEERSGCFFYRRSS